MASPCRILVLNERDPLHPSAGGAEVHLSEVFGRLAARGYEVVVAASSFPGASLHECVNGLRVRRLGGLARYYPRVAWTCARETRRGAFDLVIENFNKVPFFAPLYAGAPVLVLCHHLFGRVAFRQTAWPLAAAVFGAERCVPLVYRRCQFVAVSESSRSDLVRRGISEPLIRVIHNGVTPCSVPVDTTRVRSERVAYVGRLEPYKRIDLVLRAFASVKNRFSAAELVVIGRGKARAKLERLARELGLEGRARFTGFVSDRTRDELLAGSRLAVCASPKEGWGITVIEANAAGTPVVASDAPGLRDSVRHGETGLLVAGDRVEGFAEAIARLLSDDGLSLRMSRAALAWSKQFGWDRAASEMAEAIDQARAGADGPGP